jgi:hypothetical protein
MNYRAWLVTCHPLFEVVGKRVGLSVGLDHSRGLLNSVRASIGWSEHNFSKARTNSVRMSRLTRDVFKDGSVDVAWVLRCTLLERVFPMMSGFSYSRSKFRVQVKARFCVFTYYIH